MPDLPSLLSAAAGAAQPSAQPEFSSIRERASRRATRRRTALVVSVAAAVVIGSVAVAQGLGGSAAEPSGPSATPCASPFSDSDSEPSVAFPHDGSRIDVSIPVNGHVTVGWSGCHEHGTIQTSDPAADVAPATATDVSVYSSPRPVPSGLQGGCCSRPPADGVFLERYTAQRPGSVTLRGTGSQGSKGTIVIHVIELSPDESRAISGVTDTRGLRSHPGPEWIYLLRKTSNGTSTVALVTGHGTFSLRLRPGTYEVRGNNPAYNDGRAQCAAPDLVVGDADITGVRVVCTERS